MFSVATAQHKNQLKELWKICFGDEDSYIDLFFDNRFVPDQCIIGEVDGKVVTMLFTLPLNIVSQGLYSYPARYIYAVATHPSYRSHGFSTQLMEFTHGYLYTQGVALSVLVPASGSLFTYYEKRGYKTQFNVSNQTYYKSSAIADNNIFLEKTTLPEVEDLRNELLSQLGLYGKWDKNALEYNQKELELLGGQAVKIKKDNDFGYALCYPSKEGYFVKEFIYTGKIENIAYSLMEYLSTDKIEVRLTPSNESYPFAMAKWYCTAPDIKGENSYLGLVLD